VLAIEPLAANKLVRFIELPAKAMTNTPPSAGDR
jgi:hypothetical protein